MQKDEIEAAGVAPTSHTQSVPVEPTEAMIEAGAAHVSRLSEIDPEDTYHRRAERYRARGCAIAVYKDMLEASSTAASGVNPSLQAQALSDPPEVIAAEFDRMVERASGSALSDIDAALAALVDVKPLANYGEPGTYDTMQARRQRALAQAEEALLSLRRKLNVADSVNPSSQDQPKGGA